MITKGAVFDYEEIVCKIPFDFYLHRESMEDALRAEREKEGEKNEYRVKYFDEVSDKDLILFIKKGYAFGIMQMWILEGICEGKDYKEEMESDGTIKKWLEVEIE